MKICYIADAWNIHSQRWIKYFARKNHEIDVISWRAPDSELRNINLHLINNSCRPYSYILDFFSIKKLIKEKDPDIIHVHSCPQGMIFGAFSNHHPFVYTVWGSDLLIDAKKSKLYRFLIDRSLKHADIITCDSEKMKREAMLYCKNQEIVSVIQWGVDLNTFKKLNSYPHTIRPVVLSTRTFEPLYNIDTIIESVPYVITKFPDTKFILKNGWGTDEPQLRELAKKLNVLQNIQIVSQMVEYNDMPKFLNDANIFVSVPSSDSSSVSLNEAMACALPVVVSDLPANREWIKDGLNGYIVPVRDSKALADAILKLLENREQRELFGKRNVEIIIERADHEKHMLRMEELYKSLILKHTKR